MNVMSAGTMPLRTQVKSSMTGLPSGDDKLTQSGGKNWGDSFTPSNEKLKKGAFAVAYFGLPFAAGLAGAGPLPSYGSMALSAGAAVYGAREQPGMQKAMAGLSGFFVASASRTIGQFAMNPSLGGALSAGISGLILAMSGPRLLQMSE